jgi:hypothetical protein
MYRLLLLACWDKQVHRQVNDLQINVSDLNNGVYMIQLVKNGKNFTGRFVKL